MAKGLRSKTKRHFRTVKRQLVSQDPTHLAKEKSKQESLNAILEAPKPEKPPSSAPMDIAKNNDTDAMAIDADLPPLTTKNPAKLARKLKQRRLAAERGIKAGIKKKSKPLAGANQFHKKKKKR